MHMFCDIIIVTMNYEYKMVLDYYKMCMNYYCLVHLNHLLYCHNFTILFKFDESLIMMSLFAGVSII